MKTGFVKTFLVIESLLLLVAVFQIVRSPEIWAPLITGILLVKVATSKRRRHKALLWIGGFIIVMAILSVFAVWVMLFVGVIFLILAGGNFWKSFYQNGKVKMPWEEKRFVGVETEDPPIRDGYVEKQKWFGNTEIGDEIYEWDDINITQGVGDHLIDLGNTILPNTENVIVIRKALGKTRIIVPTGIGVAIHHATLSGKLTFEGETTKLFNENLRVFSKNYDESNKRVKIFTTVLHGDLEVIYV